MLADLKEEVFRANLDLVDKGMVIYTWGNVSGIDRDKGLIVIKPSGVDYSDMRPEDMVVVDLEGNIVEGKYRPSSDTPTHLVLYREYDQIGGIVHTHSSFGVTYAQAGMAIPAMGTTHADYFYGDIPCTRALTEDEISEGYEENTGHVIVETIGEDDPMQVPGIVVKNHGPFAWGKDAANSVYNAVVLEEVAKMAYQTKLLNPQAARAPQFLLDKHYFRKHGPGAYYGQGTSN